MFDSLLFSSDTKSMSDMFRIVNRDNNQRYLVIVVVKELKQMMKQESLVISNKKNDISIIHQFILLMVVCHFQKFNIYH